MTTRPCRCGSGHLAPTGRQWAPACLRAYRKSEDYRAKVKRRGDQGCARCPAWVDRWANAALAKVGRQRQYATDTDHIIALANGGTHDDWNLQLLCKAHHRRKTRRDMATLHGRWQEPSRLGGLAILTVLVLAVGLWQDPRNRGTLGVAGVVLALGAGWYASRRRAKQRLRVLMAVRVGEAITKRGIVRAWRWRLRRVPGAWFPRWVPGRMRIKLPLTYPIADTGHQDKLEDEIRALGGTWQVTPYLATRVVKARSPDPFANPNPSPWPNLTAERLSMWDPIPIGRDVHGHQVSVNLTERNILVGGVPGAGKSVALGMLVGTAALDPAVELHLLDGKKVELAFWRHCAETLVGPSCAEACDVLSALQDAVELRYDLLLDGGQRKIEQGGPFGQIVVAIDELAYYTTGGSKAERERFENLLRDLVSRGRAAGVIVLAATQRPSHDVIPTSIRGLLAYRLAMRCTDPASSDMVLGQGAATLGYRADRIDPSTPGVGLLLAEGGVPQRIKAHYLSDAHLRLLAARGAALRGRSPKSSEDAPADRT